MAPTICTALLRAPRLRPYPLPWHPRGDREAASPLVALSGILLVRRGAPPLSHTAVLCGPRLRCRPRQRFPEDVVKNAPPLLIPLSLLQTKRGAEPEACGMGVLLKTRRDTRHAAGLRDSIFFVRIS